MMYPEAHVPNVVIVVVVSGFTLVFLTLPRATRSARYCGMTQQDLSGSLWGMIKPTEADAVDAAQVIAQAQELSEAIARLKPRYVSVTGNLH